MSERERLWSEYEEIAKDTSYSVKDAIKSTLEHFSGRRRTELFRLRQLALYEWIVCASVLPHPVLKSPILDAPAKTPRFTPPGVSKTLGMNFPNSDMFVCFCHWDASRNPASRLRFNDEHAAAIRSILQSGSFYRDYFIYVMFPGLFGHFSTWEQVFHVNTLFEVMGPNFLHLADLIATFLVHAIRFQTEIFNWFDQTGDLREAIFEALPYLSEWHVKVLRRLKSDVRDEALRKFISRMTKFWPTEPKLSEENFRGLATDVAGALLQDAWVEYPKAAKFYAMSDASSYPFLSSGADLSLMWFFTRSPHQLPSVEDLADYAFHLTFGTAAHGEATFALKSVAPPASDKIRIKYAEYEAEAMDKPCLGLKDHPDHRMAEYGLRLAIQHGKEIKDTHDELRDRVLAVDLVVADTAMIGELLDRSSLKLAELHPLDRTIDDTKNSLAKLWAQIEPTITNESRKLVTEGFEIYSDGQLRRHECATELWPQLVETDFVVRDAQTSRMLFEMVVTQNQPWLMKTTGEALIGWSRLCCALSRFDQTLFQDSIVTALPLVLLRLFPLVIERLNALADDGIRFRRDLTDPLSAFAERLRKDPLSKGSLSKDPLSKDRSSKDRSSKDRSSKDSLSKHLFCRW